MLAGSPPCAIAPGIVSPRSAITRQCAAPTLWRCQCIASVFFPSTCTRYIPSFLTPDSGSLGGVITRDPESGVRIPRYDSTERDVWPAVLGPADRRRELREVDVGALEDRVLARRSADCLGRELRHLREARQ